MIIRSCFTFANYLICPLLFYYSWCFLWLPPKEFEEKLLFVKLLFFDLYENLSESLFLLAVELFLFFLPPDLLFAGLFWLDECIDILRTSYWSLLLLSARKLFLCRLIRYPAGVFDCLLYYISYKCHNSVIKIVN